MGAYRHNNLIFLFLILHGKFLYMGAQWQAHPIFPNFTMLILYMGPYTDNNLIFLFLILHGNLLYMGAQWQTHLIIYSFASSFFYIHGCKMASSFYSF